jgi:hypothetical protein
LDLSLLSCTITTQTVLTFTAFDFSSVVSSRHQPHQAQIYIRPRFSSASRSTPPPTHNIKLEMSDPYNQYPHQYGGSPAPSGYGQQGQHDPNYPQGQSQGQYPPQHQQGWGSAPPAPTYGDDNQYGQQQQSYGQEQGYGQHQGQGYGPPATGGFQHGQSTQHQDPNQQQYGGYNQQQEMRGDSYGSSQPANQYPQSGPYNQAPFDPNNPNASGAPGGAEDGERGLMGALSGGAAGAFGGHKLGHGFIGAIAGAVLGSAAEDKLKDKHNKHNQGGGGSGW